MPPPLFSKPTCSILIIIIVVISIPIVGSNYRPIFELSPYPHAAANLCIISIPTCYRRSRALRPLLLTLSFIFSLPLCFLFSLHLEFVGLRCGWDAMLGVVGLQWFFVDRASLWWYVVGLCDGSVSGFCILISVSFNFSGFDWFWWVLDFGGWVCGLIGVVQRWVWVDRSGFGSLLWFVDLDDFFDFVILWFGWFFDFVALDVEGFFFFFAVVCGCGDGGWMWWLWNGWVDMVASGERETQRRERQRKREEE